MDEIKEILDCQADPVGQIQLGHISKAFGFNNVENLSLNHHRKIKILKNISIKKVLIFYQGTWLPGLHHCGNPLVGLHSNKSRI